MLTHSTVDPLIPNPADRMSKLRGQQEVRPHVCFSASLRRADIFLQRQGMAYILVRQATSLLQRTNLNVTIACQAWHAKNARHMLLGASFSVLPIVPAHTPHRHRRLRRARDAHRRLARPRQPEGVSGLPTLCLCIN